MQRLELEITAEGQVPAEIFVKLVGVPAKRCNLRGSLRVLNSQCSIVSVAAEGPEEDVMEYYNYMRLCDQVAWTVTKVEEHEVSDYTETKLFHVVNYEQEATDGDDETEDSEDAEDVDDVKDVEEEHRKSVGVPLADVKNEPRVIPETPEKEHTSSSDSEAAEEEPVTPGKEDRQTMCLNMPMSPVFKGGRPQARRERVGNQSQSGAPESDDEESQSLLRVNRRKRKKV